MVTPTMPTPTSSDDAQSPPGPGSAVHYAYMFEKDKSPTKQLDALLRAIARHIVGAILADERTLAGC